MAAANLAAFPAIREGKDHRGRQACLERREPQEDPETPADPRSFVRKSRFRPAIRVHLGLRDGKGPQANRAPPVDRGLQEGLETTASQDRQALRDHREYLAMLALKERKESQDGQPRVRPQRRGSRERQESRARRDCPETTGRRAGTANLGSQALRDRQAPLDRKDLPASRVPPAPTASLVRKESEEFAQNIVHWMAESFSRTAPDVDGLIVDQERKRPKQ